MSKIKDKDSNNIKVLISKVKSLADNGEAGEKETAKRKLTELLIKYNIKKFDESKYKNRSFKLADFNDCKIIMVHCILDTLKNAKIEGNTRKKELYCKLTDEQYIDVCQKFNHYYPEFIKQREAFIKAFIIKNNLGIIEGENNTHKEEIESIRSIYSSINANRYNQKNLN